MSFTFFNYENVSLAPRNRSINFTPKCNDIDKVLLALIIADSPLFFCMTNYAFSLSINYLIKYFDFIHNSKFGAMSIFNINFDFSTLCCFLLLFFLLESSI